MFSWLKRLISGSKRRKSIDTAIENLPTEHADMRNALPLDPKNDPWGRT